VARVPQADRLWLAAMNAALLVPIFAGWSRPFDQLRVAPSGVEGRAESKGDSDPRPFIGLIALGQKRSEEPYTPEDRELLRGIAVQMGVALDLSRLRKQAEATQVQGASAAAGDSGVTGTSAQAFTPTIVVGGSGSGAGIAVGALIDGKYRVDGVIGQGGMGAVFKAWDVRLERAVAIKVVRADVISDPDSRVRFRRESQIVARLQHPSIVTVFDYGNFTDGSAFLVMEFVPGEDLRRLLKREGALSPARVTTLLSGIADGVELAHKSGITTPGTGDGSTISVAGTIVGTPAYMPPEQLRGEAVDARSDVFSLGVMAYEMLTARLPYTGASLFDIGMKQVEGKVDLSGMSPALGW
jgi:hypothetical protein